MPDQRAVSGACSCKADGFPDSGVLSGDSANAADACAGHREPGIDLQCAPRVCPAAASGLPPVRRGRGRGSGPPRWGLARTGSGGTAAPQPAAMGPSTRPSRPSDADAPTALTRSRPAGGRGLSPGRSQPRHAPPRPRRAGGWRSVPVAGSVLNHRTGGTPSVGAEFSSPSYRWVVVVGVPPARSAWGSTPRTKCLGEYPPVRRLRTQRSRRLRNPATIGGHRRTGAAPG
jgi:hypothetical protein